MEQDAPSVQDTTLIGWGSWGGKGVKKRKTPAGSRFLKTSAGVEATDRKDANRHNVIITEKRDKKATKHLAKDLPYPYTSVAQYEAAFANPVGGEFNSRAGYQRQTLPRVLKKPGAIIEPVRKLF
jgi:U3 small nucleolar RNA-associated protein 14